jgi:hypothetical protein
MTTASDWRALTRPQQIMIYVVAKIDELRAAGLIRGGHVRASERAIAAAEQMNAEGFKPEKQEILQALQALEAHYDRTFPTNNNEHTSDGNEGADPQDVGVDPR